jgi:hypothetical protein
VRDAAYGSLLKSRRQELHAGIAEVLERDYPDVVARQSELIAHHLSEARLPDQAVVYWQRAAERAARRQAHQEAIAHCMRGLEMVSLIHDPGLCGQHELRLQVRLGNSATSAKGYSALEGRTDEARATLSGALKRHPDLTIEGFVSDSSLTDTEREHLIRTMRSAGFPACAKPESLAHFAQPVRLPECVKS